MKLKPYPEYKDSGVPWLGKIPKHWDAISVKRLFSIQLGKMLQGTQVKADEQCVHYLKAQHVQWFAIRTSELPTMWASPEEVVQFGVQPGDLLICEGGEGGRCGIVKQIPDPCIIQNALHRVRPVGIGCIEYLQYVMSAVAATGWFAAINSKATIAHFTREKFGALGIPVPPSHEQNAIAAFLAHTDHRINRLIRAKRRMIELLNEQKQIIIHRSVTRGLDPNVRLKFSGIDWLGDVPTHWEVLKLKYLVETRGGMTPSKAEVAYWNGNIPWVSPKDMKVRELSDSLDHISHRALNEIGITLIDPPAVLIVVRGMILARAFPVAVTTRPVTVNQDMKALRLLAKINCWFRALAREYNSTRRGTYPA